MDQIKKNTVSAENQLKESDIIKFYGNGDGIKVIFVGNSITRHGVSAADGWYGDYGMAASCEQNDYVHITMNKIQKDTKASFCVCHASDWEKKYINGSEKLDRFIKARNFDADIIVMRVIENSPINDFNKEAFEKQYIALINYINKSKKAKIIITTSFWKHPGDDALYKIANEFKYPIVYLGDLGEDSTMKAIGLFKHEGIANHPGDKGMDTIARRIYGEINKIIN